ncbi:MAG: hypothetical protein JST65_18895 [Acidobacteria bacterium]|nr:hypothetical protein [Acidobacteriota bacterium]
MRKVLPSFRAIAVLTTVLSILAVVSTPAAAQSRDKDKDKDKPKHHDRSNPKPPKDDKDKNDRSDNVSSLNGAAIVNLTAASQQVTTALRSGSVTSMSGGNIPVASQQTVLAALTAGEQAQQEQLVAALTSNGNEHAKKEAKRLVARLHGLSRDGARLPDAIKVFNELIDASSTEFLSNPPAELLAIQSTLARMVQPLYATSGER